MAMLDRIALEAAQLLMLRSTDPESDQARRMRADVQAVIETYVARAPRPVTDSRIHAALRVARERELIDHPETSHDAECQYEAMQAVLGAAWGRP